MKRDFEKGYRDGCHAGDILGSDDTSQEDVQYHLEISMELGLIENAGYWTGRLTIFGTDPTLDDGTMLSY